jgi:hypothetical protein
VPAREGDLHARRGVVLAVARGGHAPYRGSGIDIYASTGPVGQAGSEFWGSSQAVLAIAIWASTSRVVHFPGSYNLPLHMVAGKGSIDPQWTEELPVHVHYHYMFSPQRHEVAMAILEELGVPRTGARGSPRGFRSASCPRRGRSPDFPSDSDER